MTDTDKKPKRRLPEFADVAGVLGFGLIVTGVAMISKAAAVIIAGVMLLTLAVKLVRP